MKKYKVTGAITKEIAVASGSPLTFIHCLIKPSGEQGKLWFWTGGEWSLDRVEARELTPAEVRVIQSGTLPVDGQVGEYVKDTRFTACSEFYHRVDRNKDGTPVRCRPNGTCKTWVQSPERFRLPVKHGIRDYFCLFEDTSRAWGTECEEIK